MDILDQIKYNKDFQSTIVENKNDFVNPILDIIGYKYKSLDFTYKVFKSFPELFNNKGSSLYYIQNAGQSKKTTMLFQSFEIFLTQSPDSIMDTIMLGKNPIDLDVDMIISWARYIKQTKKCYIFEPIMKMCNLVLQSFLDTKSIEIRGKTFNMKELKPLMYSNTGENITDLLPYIAYLYNFFINCKNYTFGEILAGSHRNLFMESIDSNFSSYYQKLISSSNQTITLNQLFTDTDNFVDIFGKETIISMYNEMLDPKNIIKIRNDAIISDTSGQLQGAISQQAGVNESVVEQGFLLVLSQLIEITIDKNPITKLFNKIPLFSQNVLNEYELSMLTHYALSGGVYPFMIDSELNYVAVGDISSIKYCKLLPKQEMQTDIVSIKYSNKKPFSQSSLPLNLITSYVKKEFQNEQTDILIETHIGVDETMIYQNIDKDITGLFVNGIWMRNNNFLVNVISKLSDYFKTTINNILSVVPLLDYFFDNPYGSKIVPAYILSFLPNYLLSYLQTNSSISLFCPITYFCRTEEVDYVRIEKLLAIETSLLYLHNEQYITFVNKKADEMNSIILMNSFIQQAYVKGTSDNIDVYAIGGRDLVEKAAYNNPLSRAYWYVLCTQGTCENMEMLYEWIKLIDNSYAFQLLEEAINNGNISTINNIIENNYNELVKSNKIPILLSNYLIDGDKISFNSTPYYMNYKFSNNVSIISFLCNYAFPGADARNIQDKELYMKPITYNNGVFYAGKSEKERARFGNNVFPISKSDFGTTYSIPFYDFTATMEDIGLSMNGPPNYRWFYLSTDSGRNVHNDVYFIFTKLNYTKFGMKNGSDNFVDRDFDNIYDDKSSTDPDENDMTKNRMMIYGLKKKVM